MTDIDLSLVEMIEESPGVPMAQAVAPGETLYFDVTLSLAGEPLRNIGVVVLTPPNPNGGFEIIGLSVSGQFFSDSGLSAFFINTSTRNYKADSFNTNVGTFAAGHSSTLEGSNNIRVRGVLANGDQPGLLRIAVGPPAPVISLFAFATPNPPTDLVAPSGVIVLQDFEVGTVIKYQAMAWIAKEELLYLLRDYVEPGNLDHYESDGAIVPDGTTDSVSISVSGELGQVLIVNWSGFNTVGSLSFTGDWSILTLGTNGGKYVFTGDETKTFSITWSNSGVRDGVLVIAAAVVTPQ